jgi:hypothetical protein
MYAGFKEQIQNKFNSIQAVYEHKNTELAGPDGLSIGRWNLMVKTENFNKTAKALKQTIYTMYEDFVSENPDLQKLDGDYKPRVTSKINFEDLSDDDSTNTRDSFVSFYSNSSMASYKKVAMEDIYYNTENSVAFGAPIKALNVGTVCTTNEQSVQKHLEPNLSDISESVTTTKLTMLEETMKKMVIQNEEQLHRMNAQLEHYTNLIQEQARTIHTQHQALQQNQLQFQQHQQLNFQHQLHTQLPYTQSPAAVQYQHRMQPQSPPHGMIPLNLNHTLGSNVQNQEQSKRPNNLTPFDEGKKKSKNSTGYDDKNE